MKIVDLNWILNGIDGVPMKHEFEDQVHAGKIIANFLMKAQGVLNAAKYFDMGMRLYRKEKVQLDQTDFQELYNFVKYHPELYVITKVQIQRYLEEIKEEN